MEQRDGPQITPCTALSQARLAQGWSQLELAERIGTTFVNVNRWERGLTAPSPLFRSRLCMLLNKSEDELGLAR